MNASAAGIGGAAAVVVAAAIAVVAAAAAAQNQDQNNDPAAVAAAEEVVIAHNEPPDEIYEPGPRSQFILCCPVERVTEPGLTKEEPETIILVERVTRLQR